MTSQVHEQCKYNVQFPFHMPISGNTEQNPHNNKYKAPSPHPSPPSTTDPPPPKTGPQSHAPPPPTDRRQPPEDICQNRHPKPNSQAQCPISLSLIEDSYRKAFTKTNILNPIPHKVVAHKIKSVTAI